MGADEVRVVDKELVVLTRSIELEGLVVSLVCGVTCASCLHEVTDAATNSAVKDVINPALSFEFCNFIIVKLIRAFDVKFTVILCSDSFFFKKK